MRHIVRTVAVVGVFVLGAGQTLGQEGSEWIGRRVVTRFGTVLKVGLKTVDEPDRGARPGGTEHDRFHVYRVQRVNGAWLWLVAENGNVNGWAPVAQVVPYRQAIDYYTTTIRANPNDRDAYVRRGKTWQLKGEFEKGIADYTEAIRIDPKDAAAYIARSEAWQATGAYDKAAADANEAIRIDPKATQAYVARGNALRATRESKAPNTDSGSAILQQLSDATAYLNRGYDRDQKGDYMSARADYNEAIRRDPRLSYAYNNRGTTWRDRSEFDKALADYNEAIRLDPKYAAPHYNRGITWHDLGEFDKALADYNEAIRIDPNFSWPYSRRGITWQSRREYNKALADFEKAIHLDHKLLSAHGSLAWLLATCPDERFRDGTRAVETAEYACELSGWKEADYLGTLAAAHAEAGDFDAAVKWQYKAQRLYTNEQDQVKGWKRLSLYREHKPYRDQAEPK